MKAVLPSYYYTKNRINIDYGTIRMMKNMDGNIERQKVY